MNWFTKGVIAGNRALEYMKKNAGDVDMCEHVEADHSKAAYWGAENDSFGLVGKYVYCAECWAKEQEREGEEEVFCNDCRQTKLKKDTFEWKWYDFYRPQGDVPLCICNECKDKEKHKQRVANDDANYRAEMGDDDWEEDY